MADRLTAKEARALATPKRIDDYLDDAFALIRQAALNKQFSVELTDPPWNNDKNVYFNVAVGALIRLDYVCDYLALSNMTRVSW